MFSKYRRLPASSLRLAHRREIAFAVAFSWGVRPLAKIVSGAASAGFGAWWVVARTVGLDRWADPSSVGVVVFCLALAAGGWLMSLGRGRVWKDALRDLRCRRASECELYPGVGIGPRNRLW